MPPKFQYLLAKCLAEDPAERYQTVAEFHRELMQLGKPSESFALPAELAKTLTLELVAGNSDKAGALLRLLLENADDEAFYKEFTIRMSKPVLEQLQEESPEGFATVVRRADEYCNGSHPFSFTDIIADFMAAVFKVAHDPALRRLALQRILLVGAYHNRFYFQEVFTRIVRGLTDPQERLMVAHLIEENSWDARFYKERLQALSLPRVIKDVVDKL